MAEILSIPAEFDVIQVEQRKVPRPPLGPFTHHAVQTFAKTCREGRLGLNWQDHLVHARETWKTLSPEELSTLRQAADEDKQRYDERVALAGQPAKRKRLGPKTRPPEDDEVAISTMMKLRVTTMMTNDDDEEETEGDEKQQSENKNTEVGPGIADGLQWRPTKDENLATNEKQLLESIPPNLRRWDRLPREARSSYTLYYADRLTAAESPHLREDPHCSSTRAKIHAAWEAAEDETRQHFENLAKSDEQEFDRQSKECNEWGKAWRDLEHPMLLRKVIDRWHPHSSFDDGQNRLRDIPPRRRQTTVAVDYGLPCLHHPVIRTDYSNAAVYEHLRHVLLKSSFLGESVMIDMTFYDGLQPPLPSTPVEDWKYMEEEDRRANDYEWCRTNLDNKSLDDLKAAFGELSFHRKEHVPIYTFGGHGYAIVIDSQSMKDGTVMFVNLSSDDVVDIVENPGHWAWEQDPKMEWYLSPRVVAADVVIQLVNLHIANFDWGDYLEDGVDQGLDLLSDPKAQQWRGWQWAIEDVFGKRALENVVQKIGTLLGDAYLQDEDEE